MTDFKLKLCTCTFMKDGRLTYAPGRDVVQLPYINYMRELGVIFLNSYTNSPICCPSRAGTVSIVDYSLKYRILLFILYYLLLIFSQLCGVVALCI